MAEPNPRRRDPLGGDPLGGDPGHDDSGRHDGAFRRLDDRLAALDVSTRRTPQAFGSESGAGAGYRLIGELIGGVLAGLGLGWMVDRFAGTAPFGLIVGVLLGTGASVFVVARSAGRMATVAEARPGQPGAAPADDDKDGSG